MTTLTAPGRIALGVLCVLMVALPAVRAQETRATVTGTVKDIQGAIVPGVTVSRCSTPIRTCPTQEPRTTLA